MASAPIANNNDECRLKNAERNIVVVKEIIIEKSFKAILYSNDIIEIIWDPSLEIIDEIQIIQITQLVFELGGGKKMLLYYSTTDFLHITANGRKYAAKKESAKYTIANALLIDNMAKKIVFNFFMNINKPTIPTLGFTNREDAFKWLSDLQQEGK